MLRQSGWTVTERWLSWKCHERRLSVAEQLRRDICRSIRIPDIHPCRAVRYWRIAPGEYRAELTRVELHRLWIQRGRASLPQIAHAALAKSRSRIFFLPNAIQQPMHHSGIELSPGDIMVTLPGSENYQRSPAESSWGAMSLTNEDLAGVGRTLVGRDLIAPAETRLIRPPPQLMSRLRRWHEAAGRLAATSRAAAHRRSASAADAQLPAGDKRATGYATALAPNTSLAVPVGLQTVAGRV
jgi:hypothetical protein